MKMTTTTYNRTYNSGTGFGKFFLLSFIVIVLITGGVALSHGVAKHGNDALSTRDCMDKNGVDMAYFKTDNRKIQLCFIGLNNDGSFKELGIRVVEKIKGKWQELTAFTNKDITTFDQAIRFAESDMGKYGYLDYIKDIWKVLITQ